MDGSAPNVDTQVRSFQTLTRSIVVGGDLAVGRLRQSLEDLRCSLGRVFLVLSETCANRGQALRVITGAGTNVELLAAETASRMHLPLFLLGDGVPGSASEQPFKVHGQIWLGADQVELSTGVPRGIRNEIAIAFAEVAIIVCEEPNLNRDETDLLLHAALAMKPVILLDGEGCIRVLERERLTASLTRRLESPYPPVQMLMDCFSASLRAGDDESLKRTLVSMSYDLQTGNLGRESHIGLRPGTIHSFMMSFAQGRFRRAFAAVTYKPISPYRGAAWVSKKGLLDATPLLDQQFDDADVVASIAAGKHRSAAWISSLASTTAVFAAVAGAIDLWSTPHGHSWALIELCLVALVVAVLWRANARQWHSTWVSHRFVAEQFRYNRVGLPLMAVSKAMSEPAFGVAIGEDGFPFVAVTSEELRRVQQVITSNGLPYPEDGKAFIAADSDQMPIWRDYIREVVDDQVAYHHRVHEELHTVNHRLHQLSIALFCMTVAAIGVHFVLHAEWLLIFTAFFPALAAGMHGLTTTLEISRLAEQSSATATQLKELSVAIKTVLDEGETPWRNWVRLRHLAIKAAEVMSDENSQWQKLVTHQKPKLPA